MLTTLLPWAALVLAALALWLKEGPDSDAGKDDRPNSPWLIAGGLLVILALAAGWIWRDALKGLWPTAVGFGGGGALALIAFAFGAKRNPDAVMAPTAIGVFGSAIWTLFAVDVREPYQLGAAAGVCLGGWLLAGSGRGWPSRAAIVAALCLFVDVLGKRAEGGHSDHAGSLFGLLLAVAVLLARGVPQKPGSEGLAKALGVAIGAAVLALGAWFLAGRHFFLGNLFFLLAGGAAVGLIVAWVVPEEDRGSSSLVIAAILWLATATLAFGARQGYGMAVATLGGAGMLAMLGRSRALLSMGPLAMLVVYRLFRELHTDASRALDIGQHYALIGIVLGVALVLLAVEWRDARRGATGLMTLLWIPIFLAVPYVSAVVLAAKGFVGVLAGTGFGPLLAGLKGGSKPDSLCLQLGIGAAMVGGYGWLSEKTDLARDEKVKAMIWVAVVVVVLALALAFLSKERAETAPRTSE